MVMGCLFVKENAHENSRIKVLTQELFMNYKKKMNNINCDLLKAEYHTDELKCRKVIAKADEIPDKIIEREIRIC